MTRVPKRIKIGPHDYHVVRQPKKLDTSQHGDSCDADLRIRLGRMPRSKAQEIIVHESLHPMFYAVPIDWDDIDEERIVTMLAPKILQLIRDNPELIKYLTQ